MRVPLRLLAFLGLVLLLAGCTAVAPGADLPPATPETIPAVAPTVASPALRLTSVPPTAVFLTGTPTPTELSVTPTSTFTPAPESNRSRPADSGGTPAVSVCAYTWFFANAPEECPGQPPTYSTTTVQHFQRGLMLWREQPDVYGSQIYIFFTDNKSPAWNPTNDRWRPDMPESDPAIIPPAGYYQPVRSFGLVWREAYFGAAGSARDRLGWATDLAFASGELALQCHTGDSRLGGCYVAGPDNTVYAVGPDNRWFVWQGPTPVP